MPHTVVPHIELYPFLYTSMVIILSINHDKQRLTNPKFIKPFRWDTGRSFKPKTGLTAKINNEITAQ